METTNLKKNPNEGPEAPVENHEVLTQGDEDNRLIDSDWIEADEKFEDLNLKKDLLQRIFDFGFFKPYTIQSKAIKSIIMKKDTIVQAPFGFGKTTSYVISILQNIDHEDLKPQALILVPNRELAIEIAEVVKSLGLCLKISVHLCTGGTQISEDKKKLKEGVHLVVGTPGRIRDMMNRQILNPSYLKMLIIDEADELLGLGFLDQINEIIKMIPPDRHICLFSDIIPPEIIKLTENITNDPAKILVKKENLMPESIKQYYLSCSNDTNKYENLLEIFAKIDFNQCIIYVNTKDKAERLAQQMREKELIVSCIHGSMEQEKRSAVVKEFREGTSRILIGTDLLASIGFHEVSLVINYELPLNNQNYFRRVSRIGRLGDIKFAVSLISMHEASYLIEIQEFYHTHIAQLPTDLAEM